MCAGIQFLEMSKKKLEDTATHSRNPRHRYKMLEELGKLVSTALSEHMERLPSQD